jgi:hypothetical protein
MDPKLVVAIIVAVFALAIATWALVSRQRMARLRKHYGSEYERTAQQLGEHQAEAALLDREKRVHSFTMRSLTADERGLFANEWLQVQSRFVDNPGQAVTDADLLVVRLMKDRGYPMAEFEQRAADLSVGYPHVVENYRAAHQIALRHEQGMAGTEDMRQALIHYRSLFDELLETKSTVTTREVA